MDLWPSNGQASVPLGDLEWVRQRHRGKGKRTAKDAAMLSFQSSCGNSLFQVWLSGCRREVLCEVLCLMPHVLSTVSPAGGIIFLAVESFRRWSLAGGRESQGAAGLEV